MAEQTTLQTAVKIEMENLPNGTSTSDPVVNNNSAINREIDFDFLPLIYEVIKSIEREPIQDASGKSRENQDTSAKVLELEKKLNEARQQILLLPGIEHSKEEQLRQLELTRKLADSYPIRRAAQMVVYVFNKSKAITEDSKVVEQLQTGKLAERLKEVRDKLERKLKE